MKALRPATMKILSSLRRRNDGATALEFGFVAAPLMLLLAGIVEVSLAMFAQHVMEAGTFAAARQGKTGFVAQGSTREQMIVQAVYQRAGGLLDQNQLSVTSVAYNQFSQIGDPEPFVDANGNGRRDAGENFTDVNGNGSYDEDMGSAGPGASRQVVVYTVTYPWRLLTPMLADLLGVNGVVNLSSRTVIENEPF